MKGKRMAKKDAKVIVYSDYFDLLRAKADLLDEICGYAGATITIDVLKETVRLYRLNQKLPYERDYDPVPYTEPSDEVVEEPSTRRSKRKKKNG